MAARWGGYRWHDFRELEGEMQADVVAAYRTAQRIEAVLGHETAHKVRASSRIGAALSKLRGKGRR